MTTAVKLAAGSEFPSLSMPKVGGGEVTVGGHSGWQMLVIYRGKHCPLCKKYLKGLDGLLDDYRASGVDIVVASGDPKDKAETESAEEGWRFPVGYDLSVEQMRKLGLYISNPRSPQETDRPFPEPGLFVLNPEGKAQIIDISNAPFSRPDLANVLNGIKLIKERNYPIRGTAD
ncbi:MAG: redoxin domain-containing protein [Hyphomicrobiales bacterium]|nr:redoxin domain-containing protein [Alphaproteobacteria bacterium]